ncbi:MAG: ribonuclease P [Candidatus Micrarchaeota archaeon]
MQSSRKSLIKSSVRTSTGRLLEQARRAVREGKAERSKRYVGMAFELLKKHKAGLPKEFRNSFCRKCHLVWIPGETMVAYYDRKNGCLRVRCRCGFTKRL